MRTLRPALEGLAQRYAQLFNQPGLAIIGGFKAIHVASERDLSQKNYVEARTDATGGAPRRAFLVTRSFILICHTQEQRPALIGVASQRMTMR